MLSSSSQLWQTTMFKDGKDNKASSIQDQGLGAGPALTLLGVGHCQATLCLQQNACSASEFSFGWPKIT